MFAIVRTGGKQYRVAADQKIIVDRIDGEVGDAVALDDVLMMGEGESLKDAAKETVHAEIVEQAKSKKIRVFKKRRRQGYQRTRGHRQQLTVLRITALGGKAPAKTATKTAAAKTAADTDEKTVDAAETKAAPKTAAPAKGAEPKAAAKKPAAKADTAAKTDAGGDAPAAKKKAPAKKAATAKAAPKADDGAGKK